MKLFRKHKISKMRMAVIISQAISSNMENDSEEAYTKALEKLGISQEEDAAIMEVLESDI